MKDVQRTGTPGDFDNKVYEALRKVMFLPPELMDYIADRLAMNPPSMLVSQLAGLSSALTTEVLAGSAATFTSYTPTWTSTGTQPALGNGTLVGRYYQLGKLVIGSASLTMGSTSTFGTGVYIISLPIPPAAGVPSNFPFGTGYVNIASAFVVTPIYGAGGVIFLVNSTNAVVTNLAPGTFASGSLLFTNFTYEVA